MPANAAAVQQLQTALQLTPPPALPEYRADIFVSADLQRSGIVRPRLRVLTISAATGALAAASMTGTLRVSPAPGFTWRVLRAQAYVRDTNAGAEPREATLRNLTFADIRTRGQLSDAAARLPAVGANALLENEEVAAAAQISGAGFITLAEARLTDDYDQLVTWTGAARGTFAGELYLTGFRDPLPGSAALEFYWRRTPAAADLDTAVLSMTYLACVEGMIP